MSSNIKLAVRFNKFLQAIDDLMMYGLAKYKQRILGVLQVNPEFAFYTYANDQNILHKLCTKPIPTVALQLIKILLQYGTNPNVIDIHKYTPLHYASVSNQPAAVDILLEYNANPNVPDAYPILIPLCYSRTYCNINIMRKLILAGASINEPDMNGNTALYHNLNMSGNILDLMDVCAKYSNYDQNEYKVKIFNTVNHLGQLALHQAVHISDNRYIEILNHTKNINSCDNDGNTALHYAVVGGNLSIVELLINANININIINKEGNTALHLLAKQSESKQIIKAIDIMISAGANNIPIVLTNISNKHLENRWKEIQARIKRAR